MDKPRKAKVFWSGRSQAVRLPKEYRFDADEVVIRKVGEAVILEPVTKPRWPRGFWRRMDELPPLPDDFSPGPRPSPRDERGYRDDVVSGWTSDEES